MRGTRALTRTAGSRGRMTLHCSGPSRAWLWWGLCLGESERRLVSAPNGYGVSKPWMRQRDASQQIGSGLEQSLGVWRRWSFIAFRGVTRFPRPRDEGHRPPPTTAPTRHWWKNATPCTTAMLCHYVRQPTLLQMQLSTIRQPPTLVTPIEKAAQCPAFRPVVSRTRQMAHSPAPDLQSSPHCRCPWRITHAHLTRC
jgi:hypothetical protein